MYFPGLDKQRGIGGGGSTNLTQACKICQSTEQISKRSIHADIWLSLGKLLLPAQPSSSDREKLPEKSQIDAMSDGLSCVSAEVKESVSLSPLGAAAAPQQELLCIFGTGDFGRSLGLRLLQAGYRVVYGSRRPHSCGPVPQGTQVWHVPSPQLNLGNLFIFVVQVSM